MTAGRPKSVYMQAPVASARTKVCNIIAGQMCELCCTRSTLVRAAYAHSVYKANCPPPLAALARMQHLPAGHRTHSAKVT